MLSSSHRNNNNNYKGRNHSSPATGGAASGPHGEGGGGFWSATANSVWNLLPSSILKTSSQKSSSKHYYKDMVPQPGDRYYHEQQSRKLLIDPTNCGEEPKEIEMDYLNVQNNNNSHLDSYPTPPMSPSLFILPRCMQEQCYSPVKLVAGPERCSGRAMKRIKFRSDDCDSLIEKFDKITIMETRMASNGSAEVEEDESQKDEEKKKVRRRWW